MARYLVKQEVSIAYDDYAATDSGNWGPTTVTSPNRTTQVFVRTAADGIWQLKRTVVQIKASAASTGSVKITMALKNLSTIGRNVTLLRVANVNNGPVATNDEFVSSFNSAFGQEPGASWGLGLTTNTFTFAHNGVVLRPPPHLIRVTTSPISGTSLSLEMEQSGTCTRSPSRRGLRRA